MDYYKLYCPEHPYDPVTNFCTDRTETITKPHVWLGFAPPASAIIHKLTSKEALLPFTKTSRILIPDIMREFDSKLSQFSKIKNGWYARRYLQNVIVQKIEDKRIKVQETLKKARNDCLSIVNQHFDDLEAKITAEIASEGKKNSLHSSYRLETLNTLMLKQISNLLLFSKDLSSTKFLQTAKLAQEEVFPNCKEFHLRICKELKQNQVYTATAIYRPEMLGDLTFALKRLVNLEFLLPRVQYVEGPPRIERVDEMKRANSLKRNNSASAIFTNMRQTEMTPSKTRNISSLLPKHATSIIMPPSTYPFQQLMSKSNEVMSPLTRSSRLGAGLKIIRESKRQSMQGEDTKSITSSNVSYNGKENEGLAHSMFIDTGSSFYR